MENEKGFNEENSLNPKINPEQDAEQENVFDDDNSEGKNPLGENPEQILYDKPQNVEEANEIVSDGND